MSFRIDIRSVRITLVQESIFKFAAEEGTQSLCEKNYVDVVLDL